jgi:hypothetical protein
MALQAQSLSKFRPISPLKPADLREDAHPLHARKLQISEPCKEILEPQLVIDEAFVCPIRPVAFVVPEVVDCLCHRRMFRLEPFQSAGQQDAGGDYTPSAVAWPVLEGTFLVWICEVFVL